jgi:hypothetical protein
MRHPTAVLAATLALLLGATSVSGFAPLTTTSIATTRSCASHSSSRTTALAALADESSSSAILQEYLVRAQAEKLKALEQVGQACSVQL